MLAYRFGEWLIEPHLNRASRDGTHRSLPPKAMDLLVCLLERPGDVVSTTELLQRGWPDQFVEENGVQQRIWLIRKCLGDSARHPDYIGSVAKRGYRTIAAVERVTLAPETPLPWMRDGATSPAVAVLPFVNMGGFDDDYFADGLTEDVITDLSLIPELPVVARQSVFSYKGRTIDSREIGHKLNVTHLVEGSVRRSGSQVRATAQLIDAATGHHLWAKRYDRSWEDVLSLQDELTREIVTALDVELVSGERARHRRTRYGSPEAAESFYRGLAYYNRFTEADNARARTCFETFARIEPASILSYIQLAACRQQEVLMGWSRDESSSIEDMGVLVAKALAIDEADPSALGYAGMHQLLLGHHDQSIAFAERACRVAPDMDAPCYTLGWYQMFNEKPLEAIENLKHSMRLIPVITAPRLSLLGTCYRNSDQLELAIPTLEETLRRDPSFIFGRAVLASTYAHAHELDRAKCEVDEVLRRDPHYTVTRYMHPNLYRNRKGKEVWAEALRRAGLPD